MFLLAFCLLTRFARRVRLRGMGRRVFPLTVIYLAVVMIVSSPRFRTEAQVIIQGVNQISGGTFTSAVTFSANPTLFTDGTQAAPSIAFSSQPGLGFYKPQTNYIYDPINLCVAGYGTGGVCLFAGVGAGTVAVANSGKFIFSSTASEQGAADTGVSRLGAATLAVGNGTAADVSGTVASTKLQLTATVFANLGTNLTVNGQEIFCSDCTETTPASCPVTQASCICAGSGTGAFARRVNGVNYCTF